MLTNAKAYDKGCATALAKQGVKTTGMKKLGEGFYGTGYLLKDGRVLKVTGDRSEAELAAWLVKHKKGIPTLFPRIDSAYEAACGAAVRTAQVDEMVRRVGGKPGTGVGYSPTYYIIREDLVDVSAKDRPRMTKAIDQLQNWMLSANAFAEHGSASDGQLRDLYEKRLVAQLATFPVEWQKNIVNSLLWAKKKNVFVTDIKLDNMGIRPATGDLVIRDLGLSITPTKAQLMTLQGLRLKARRL